jgi:hypothetical protein
LGSGCSRLKLAEISLPKQQKKCSHQNQTVIATLFDFLRLAFRIILKAVVGNFNRADISSLVVNDGGVIAAEWWSINFRCICFGVMLKILIWPAVCGSVSVDVIYMT